jgi:transcriptional regulator with XRE-family HTH domain
MFDAPSFALVGLIARFGVLMPAPTARPVYPQLAAVIAISGRSLSDVSHDVKCNSQYLGQIIRGRAKPSIEMRKRIASALGRHEAELFAPSQDQKMYLDIHDRNINQLSSVINESRGTEVTA